MKQKIHIDEQWLKDEYETWQSEKYVMTFEDWLRHEWAASPTIGAILGTNGFVVPETQENAEEFEAMNEEEQKAELQVRFEAFFSEAARILGITVNDIKTNLI